jgi:hypothetical protein
MEFRMVHRRFWLKLLEPALRFGGIPRYIKTAEQMALATLPQAEQVACFLHHDARVAASPFPILSGAR